MVIGWLSCGWTGEWPSSNGFIERRSCMGGERGEKVEIEGTVAAVLDRPA